MGAVVGLSNRLDRTSVLEARCQLPERIVPERADQRGIHGGLRGLHAGHPYAVIAAVLLVGGFFRSLQVTASNTIAYAEVDARRMSRATSLVSVAQQLSIAAGVAVGALCVELSVHLKGASLITADDFRPALWVIAAELNSSHA
jgi:hypothetical protein